MNSTDDEIPEEVHEKLEAFDKSLGEVEDILKPFLKIPIADMRDKIGDPLQNAKMDLMVAYTTNSLFWTYLITQGIDPREHAIKDEMIRIKTYMGRVQELQDKKKMARVDTNAAKRFVRNALWEPSKDSQARKDGSDRNSAQSSNEVCYDEESKEKSIDQKKSDKKKRKKHSEEEPKGSEKKKKKKKKKVKED